MADSISATLKGSLSKTPNGKSKIYINSGTTSIFETKIIDVDVIVCFICLISIFMPTAIVTIGSSTADSFSTPDRKNSGKTNIFRKIEFFEIFFLLNNNSTRFSLSE